MAPAIIFLRFVQYGAAAVLFGSACFFLYSPLLTQGARYTSRLLAWAAASLLLAVPLNFLAQSTLLAGSLSAAFEPETFAALSSMNFARSSLVRALAALLAFGLIAGTVPSRRQWWACALLGAVGCASFAWMGHGAAGEGAAGWVHLVADIAHLLAAAAWIGALVVFVVAARSKADANLQEALAAFSGSGTLFVAVIIATGLVNQAFLAGWNPVRILASAYGQVFAVKLALFGGMVLLAAANRFRHAPALKRALASPARGQDSIAALRRSLVLETVLAFGLLLAVSLLGTLQPVLEAG